MFCKYCGNKQPDSAKFCSKCGKKLISEIQKETSIVKEQSETKTVEVPDENKKQNTSTKTQETYTSNLNEPIKPLNSEVPDRQEINLEQTEKSQKKSIKRIVIIICILAIIIPVGLKIKKEIAVKSYVTRMWPVCVSSWNRAKEALEKCMEDPTIRNEDAAEVACLDAIESYLDYYRGMVSVKGKGDYSDMNENIEGLIAKCENMHRERGFYGLSEFDSRMTQIRAKWRAIKQQY